MARGLIASSPRCAINIIAARTADVRRAFATGRSVVPVIAYALAVVAVAARRAKTTNSVIMTSSESSHTVTHRILLASSIVRIAWTRVTCDVASA